jgi:hypothetical protein
VQEEVAQRREIKGDLSVTPLPSILHSVRERELTGRGTFTRENRRVELAFRNGNIVHAANNDPDMRLGEILLRERMISLQAYQRSVTLLLETGRRQGEILLSEGFITEETLRRGVILQIKEIIYDLMTWNSGSFVYRWSNPFEDTILLETSIIELILRGMRRVWRFSELRQILEPWDRIVVLNTQLDLSEAREVRLKSDEVMVLESIDGKKTIAEIIETVSLPDQWVMQILYGLYWARLIQFREER